MHYFNYNNRELINSPLIDIQKAISLADQKSVTGNHMVCITKEGEIAVLPEYSAYVRDDIENIIYQTDNGYTYNVEAKNDSLNSIN